MGHLIQKPKIPFKFQKPWSLNNSWLWEKEFTHCSTPCVAEDIWNKDELPQRGHQSLQEKRKVCDVPQGLRGLSKDPCLPRCLPQSQTKLGGTSNVWLDSKEMWWPYEIIFAPASKKNNAIRMYGFHHIQFMISSHPLLLAAYSGLNKLAKTE